MKTKLLQLSDVCTTAGTQIRASINHESVDEYANAMTDGATFPPVIVFHDGSEYILADGFHRVMAASRNGFKDIEVEVRKGTKSDALKYALGANSTHGIKRTNADKRRSVELALEEWPKLSTSEVARICAVSRPQVDAVRSAQHADSACSEQKETRIGADGKERKMPTRKAAAIEPDDSPAFPEDQDEETPRITQPSLTEVAAKVEPYVAEYYSRLEEVMLDAIKHATNKQLVSMSVYAAMIPKLIKDELRRREGK